MNINKLYIKYLIIQIILIFSICNIWGITDTTYYMYISLKGDNAVALYKIDKSTGQPSIVYTERISGGPASLAIHPSKKYLYVAQRSSNTISAYQIDASNGKLTFINTIAALDNPVYIATDQTGKYLLSAYYNANKAGVYAINTDGSLNATVIKSVNTGTGTNPHAIQTDPSNRFMYLTNMTGNKILQYTFEPLTGNFAALTPAEVIPPALTGPRHFVFHGTKDILYAVNETGNSVTAYQINPLSGTLTSFQTKTTLPLNYALTNKSADIHISPNNHFLYASNRGHESIAALAINATDGTLTAINTYFTTVSPREFEIDPTGSFLYSAGETNGDLAFYRINKNTGELDSINTFNVGKTPSWVLITGIVSDVTDLKKISSSKRQKHILYNYPNPFRSETYIHYFLSKPSHVSLKIYDLKGSLICTLHESYTTKGDNSVKWEAGNMKIKPGVYYCKLSSNYGTDLLKLIVIE